VHQSKGRGVRAYRSRSQKIEAKLARRKARIGRRNPEDRIAYIIAYRKQLEAGREALKMFCSRPERMAEEAAFRAEDEQYGVVTA
jgi:hypothetical protein